MDEETLERVKNQIRIARKNIGYYSEHLEEVELDTIQDEEDLRQKVPGTSKETLLEYYDSGSFDLDSRNIQDALIGRPTSGTTSEMAIYYRRKEEIDKHVERVEKATDHYFETGENKDRVMVATTFSLAPILTRQFLEMGTLVTSGSPFDISRTVETIIRMECNTLVCSPSVALKISSELSDRGYEKLEKYYFVSSGMSALTEERFRELYPDAEIMLQYGLAETGILMEQCPHLKGTNSYHRFEDDIFAYEFITAEGEEAEEGEVGEIVVTKFDEKTPLIRYHVGDLFRHKGECECGKVKYDFIGRKDDKFKLKGVTIFSDRIEEALEPMKQEINQFQVILDEVDEGDLPKPKIIIKAELKDESEEVIERVKKEFSENFQVAEEYNWKKGVEMDLFSPVEVEPTEFDDRKFKKVEDRRYSE